MTVDNNEIEMAAMDCFKKGDVTRAMHLQKEFLEKVKSSGEDHCSCPAECLYHGKCLECIVIHRGHGDHVPACLNGMVNKRIEALSGLTEHSFGKQ